MIVLSFPSSRSLARKIAKRIGAKFSEIEVKYFPDMEAYVRIKENLEGKDVIIVQTLAQDPNEKIIQLLFSSLTAKNLKARKVIALIPYLAYMRQDKMFKKYECVSAKALAKLIEASGIDAIFVLNPHLHRIKNLDEIFSIPSFNVSCEKEIADYLKKNFSKDEWILVGPDIESKPILKRISEISGFDFIVLRKKRFGPKEVKVFGKRKMKKKNAIIIDDIASTGVTLIKTIKLLKKLGFKKFYCIVIHLLSEDLLKEIKKYSQIVSTNSVQNKTSKIDVSKSFADAIKLYLTQKSIREIDELF